MASASDSASSGGIPGAPVFQPGDCVEGLPPGCMGATFPGVVLSVASAAADAFGVASHTSVAAATAQARALIGRSLASKGQHVYTVRFIGASKPAGSSGLAGAPLDVTADVAETVLRPLAHTATHPALPDEQLVGGERVLAKYSGDGTWYEARIDAIEDTEHVTVTFTGYGNVEVVPAWWITAATAPSASASTADPGWSSASAAADASAGASLVRTSAAGKRPLAMISSDGRTGGDAVGPDEDGDNDGPASLYAGLVIPDALRVLPTDSDEARARKRKKVKALKTAWRTKALEKASAQRAGAWQDFLSKKKGAVRARV